MSRGSGSGEPPESRAGQLPRVSFAPSQKRNVLPGKGAVLAAGDTLEEDHAFCGRATMSDFDTVTVSGIPEGARILDVREDYEWVAGHAAGALHIPLDQLPARLEELDPDEDLYVICRTGGRSFRAAQWLSGHGYSALNVAGGMDQWLETGLPLVSDNGLKPVIL